LDQDSIVALGEILKEYRGVILVVSHDPSFLDLFVTQVLELSHGKIETFGGNYEFYSQQKKLQLERQNELYILAKRGLKQALKSQQEAQINAEHRLIKGKKDAAKSNLGKAEQNFFKNKSEVKSGQNKNKFDRIIASKEDELAQNTPNINYPIHFKFNNSQIKNKRLLEIKKAELEIGDMILLKDINFEVYSGQKVLIQGKNGSGKSSFLKGILSLVLPESREILSEDAKISHFVRNDRSVKADKILGFTQDDDGGFGDKILKQVQDDTKSYFANDLKIVYLDQNYSLAKDDLSLEENLKVSDPDLSLTDLYKLLAYFQFSKNDGNRIVSTLSGGELVRLNLAILTLKKVDILILDEPTNNLDISTLEVLSKVIKEFQGTLILVCHNAWFCGQIDFNKVYKIEKITLKMTKKG
jgi:ATPase subunit of ABC transporter with duplicated ATPase domains